MLRKQKLLVFRPWKHSTSRQIFRNAYCFTTPPSMVQRTEVSKPAQTESPTEGTTGPHRKRRRTTSTTSRGEDVDSASTSGSGSIPTIDSVEESLGVSAPKKSGQKKPRKLVKTKKQVVDEFDELKGRYLELLEAGHELAAEIAVFITERENNTTLITALKKRVCEVETINAQWQLCAS